MWYFQSAELVLQVILKSWSAPESLGDFKSIWLGTCPAFYKLLSESENHRSL